MSSGFEELVRKRAYWALGLGLASIFCCGLVAGPLAIATANRATELMESENVGREYASLVRLGRGLGYVGIVLWAIGAVARILSAL